MDDEQEATTLEMPTSSSSIPTVASLLETNQSDLDELKKNPKKANQRYFYLFINLITIDNRHYNLISFTHVGSKGTAFIPSPFVVELIEV